MNTRSIATLLITSASLCTVSHAQELYVNAGGSAFNPAIGTGSVARNGAAAPVGKQWSELAREFDATNILGGIAAHAVDSNASYRVADDFTITDSGGWLLTGLRFFAYEPTPSIAGSPVAAMNVRIWNGVPESLGATVVWGDAAVNIATVASPTSYLRIFSTDTLPAPIPADQSRPIWQVEVPVSIRLAPGTYWIDWQYMLRPESETAFTPTATINNQRSLDGSNSMQHDDLLGWIPTFDEGRPAGASDEAQELPFVLVGGIACPADIDNSGGVDGDDVITFFAQWDNNQMDFNGDGGTDGDDVIAFFASWDSGC